MKEENLDPFIEQVDLVTKTSAKTGNPYSQIRIRLSNGMDINVFPHPAEAGVLKMLLKGGAKA